MAQWMKKHNPALVYPACRDYDKNLYWNLPYYNKQGYALLIAG